MKAVARYILCAVLVVLVVNDPRTALAAGAAVPRENRLTKSSAPPPNFGAFLSSFYRKYLSPVDGHECPSLPSCSAYSIQAFRKHGFFMGWMMTVDRLFHEGSEEKRVSPVVLWHGKWKILDPVANNDFWWFHEERKADE